ncbi:Vacuolar protein sorting-associated protein 29 [Thelohanellus kitauei]|uniref:Vacuolar protein sorting-associated protein 29 n=1 Tax=Thelohanellus kitauei TaxID=669202 RepID=A0A0C2MNN6_THEKT|nr:Vacuolar protein sorting-associated protein 29 [Thelohanellus kitauei]
MSLEDKVYNILAVGDLHIPDRCIRIPPEFEKILLSQKIDKILCTGNLNTRVGYGRLEEICRDIITVQGEFDNDREYSEVENVQIGDFTVTLFHGHKILPSNNPKQLETLALQYNSDILIFGSTHKLRICLNFQQLCINPGSFTGAFHPLSNSTNPSFVLMKIAKNHVCVESYELLEGQIFSSIQKFEKQTKNGSSIQQNNQIKTIVPLSDDTTVVL